MSLLRDEQASSSTSKIHLDDTSTWDALTSEKITFITLLCLLEICRCIRQLLRTWGVGEVRGSRSFYST